MEQSAWITVLQACIPIFVAIVGIVPTIVSNRKKTQETIETMQTTLVNDINNTKNEVTSLKTEVATLQTGFNAHVAEEEEHRAKQARYRILRFYDEVCAGVEHSESHWEDVLDDADFYENYCEHNKDFKNSRGHIAIQYLRETYAMLKKSGKFLTHK